MAATCSPRGEYKPTDSMTESARARRRARYNYIDLTPSIDTVNNGCQIESRASSDDEYVVCNQPS